jgi:WD40 repeat protein
MIPTYPHIIFVSSEKNVYRWNVESGELAAEPVSHQGNILAIASDLQGVNLASAGEDTYISIWNWQTGEMVNTLVGHTGTIYAVDFSVDGKFIASSSRDETVKLWDVQTGQCLKTYREPRPYEGLNISEASGLTTAQKAKLISLGAIEE